MHKWPNGDIATADDGRVRSAAMTAPERAPRRSTIIRPASEGWRSIGTHLRRLVEYRDLLRTLSLHRIDVRYRQTILGVAWAVLQPLLMMVIFAAVFSRLARIPSEGVPYALFAYAALLPWTCFSTAVTNGTGSLVSHTHLITKVYFPREILPITYVLVALFDFALGLVALALLMTWYDVGVTTAALLLIPVVALLAAWSLAVALALSALQVRWRDVGVALPVAIQLGMFVSPVIYPLGVVPEAWRPLYLLNPMAGIIQSFRDIVLRGQAPEAVPLFVSALVTAVALPLAYLVFKRTEATIADII
jgi:lipopolysaccharide transport system permease protein